MCLQKRSPGGEDEAVNSCYVSCSVVMALCSVPPVSGVGQFVPPTDGCAIFSETAASCPGAAAGRIS